MPVFNVGDKVYAKWPSTHKWYPATITQTVDTSHVCVLLDEGSRLDELPIKDVKSEGRMSRSRGRSRSRSRSRGRSKSPARKAKQSPSPTRKARSATKQQAPKTPKTPTTPTRQSARIKELTVKQETEKEEQAKAISENDRGDSSAKSDSKRTAKEKSTSKPQYQNGGPIGTFVTSLVVPVFLLATHVACNKKSCSIKDVIKFPKKLSDYYDCESVCIVVGWIAFQAALAMVPVGKVVKGMPLKSGKTLLYRLNGLFALIVSCAGVAGLIYMGYPVTKVYNKLFTMLTASIVLSFVIGAVLFIKSRNIPESDRAEAGNTGCPSYDFFMGREMNPRIGSLDLKLFLMFRPGVMAFAVLNGLFLWKAYSENTMTSALAFAGIAQLFFIIDNMIHEDVLLTGFDINNFGLGFFHVFACLPYVAFFVTNPTRYLLEHPQQWHPACIAGFSVLFVLGYCFFRGANSEKKRFRRDPHNPVFASFTKIPTSSNKKLLASGWWGIVRHPNYLGSLIMNLAWSLPCGFTTVVPWLCMILTGLVLLNRISQTEQSCRKKHGAGYDRYCREVKYRLIPHVY